MFLENFSSLVNEGIFALILRDNELNDKLSCHINQKSFWGFGFQKLIIKNWIENVMNFILFYLETKNKVIKLYSKADKKKIIVSPQNWLAISLLTIHREQLRFLEECCWKDPSDPHSCWSRLKSLWPWKKTIP